MLVLIFISIFIRKCFCFFSPVIHVICPQAEKKNVSGKWRESAIDIRSTRFTFSLPLAVESSCDELVGSGPKARPTAAKDVVRADVEILSFL